MIADFVNRNHLVASPIERVTKFARICANAIFIKISKDDLQIICIACDNHILSNIIHRDIIRRFQSNLKLLAKRNIDKIQKIY